MSSTRMKSIDHLAILFSYFQERLQYFLRDKTAQDQLTATRYPAISLIIVRTTMHSFKLSTFWFR